MASQMSMPIRSARMASSLTSAMFTARNVFSMILAISALSGDETDVDRVADARVERRARAACRLGVMPPTTLGVLRMPQRVLPGSTRSGLKARKTSCADAPAAALQHGRR